MLKVVSKAPSLMILLVCWAGSTSVLRANVNLEWRPEPGPVPVGGTLRVGLYAVSDDGETNQVMAGMDVIVSWDPALLQLLGVDNNGPYAWMSSRFPFGDPFGLNESDPPADGDGLYLAQGGFTLPEATPAGLLVTTFQFRALASTCGTVLSILDSGGSPATQTVVWSGIVPGTPVTGQLGALSVAIDSAPCIPGDLNCDGVLNGGDVNAFALALIDPAAYATSYNCDIRQADMNGDGSADLGDVQPFINELLFGGVLQGDMNCDGALDGHDVAPFVLAVTDPIAYAGMYACNIGKGDMNGDGAVDINDLQLFATALLGG